MPCLVYCDGTIFLLGDHLIALLQATNDAVDSGREVLLGDSLLVVAGCDECSLITYIGYICTGETGGLTCQEIYVEGFVDFDFVEMNLENLDTVVDIGEVDINLTVEATGAHKRLVEYIGAVGSSEQDDATVGAEAVHLGEELVEGILALVVGAEVGIATTSTAYGVDLVDEYDAGGFLLGLTEEVADTRGTDADKHLDEVATRHGEEGYVCLAGDSLGKEGLAGTGRTYEESALGYLATQLCVSGGILEEVYNLADLGLSLGEPGDILEGDFDGIILVEESSLGLAYREDTTAATAAVHASSNPYPGDNQQDHREYGQEDAGELATLVEGNLTLQVSGGTPSIQAHIESIARGHGCHDLSLDIGIELGSLEDFLSHLLGEVTLGDAFVGIYGNVGNTFFLDYLLEASETHFL